MKLRHRSVFGSMILSISIMQSAQAATFYWDGTTGNWNDLTKWSTDLAGTIDPAGAPLATVSDVLNFNATPGAAANSIVYLNGNRGSGSILATLNFNNTSGTTTLLGGVSGTGANNDLFTNGLTVSAGSGAVTIGDTNASPTAQVNVKAGSISFTNNSTSLLTFANGLNSFGTGGITTFTFAGSGNIRTSGVIGNGTGTNVVAIAKTGAGTMTIAGINTNTGSTTVSGGTLTVASTGVINNNNGATVAGTASGSVSGGATLRIDGGTAKFNVATAADSGLLVGTTTQGNVVVTNNGTLTISTGRLILGGSGAGTGTSTFTQDSGTTTVASNLYTANFNATTMNISGGSFTVNGSSIISQRANTDLNISGTATVTFPLLTLGGQTGVYNANVNLNGGVLAVNNIANAVNGTTALNFNGGTLRARAASADFLRADTVTIGNNGGTIDTQTFNVTVGQDLSRLSGATTDVLTKIGAGVLTLTGTNTYGGGSSVSAGILQFGNTAALPTSGAYAATGSGTLAVNAGGSGEFTNAASGAGTIGGFFAGASFASGTSFGIDTTNAGGSLVYAGNLTGTGVGLNKLGTGTLTLSGNNTYTGTTTITAGTLQSGSSTAFAGGGTLVMANATNTFDLNGNNASFSNLTTGAATNTITTTAAGSGTDTLTITGLTTASGALFTDNGTRKLALSLDGTPTLDPLTNASNTFSGGLSMANMRLGAVNNSAVTGGRYGKGTITIGNASQIYFNSANVTISNDLIVNSAAGNGSRTGSFRIQSTGSTLSGTITASGAAATFSADAAGSILLTGKLTGTNGFTFNQSFGTTAWTATLNNASANNDYQGNTTIGSAQTTLKLGAADQIANGANTGTMAVTLGTLDLNGYNETINGLTGAGTIDNLVDGAGLGSNTLTIGDNNATGNTFTGTIKNTAGALRVVKIGTGTQLLQTGTSTFTGGLTIRNGAIVALNSTVLGGAGGNSGAITLGDTSGSNSASLLIQGTNLTISNAVTLATNASVGALTIGASSAAGGATNFAGGVTGTNNLTLGNGSASTLTFQTAAINNAGTVTNAGAGVGSTSIAVGFGSNVTDIIQNSTTSALTIASGVTSTNTGSVYIKAGTLQLNGPAGGTVITPVNNGVIYLGDTVGTSNATLAFGNTNTLANAIVVQSNSNASTKAINVNTSGTPVYTGGITLNDNLDVTTSSSSGLTIQTGDVTINNNSTLAFKPSGTNAGTFTISSKITGTGGKVEFAGTTSASPTYIITAANDYTGTTTISKGTLRIGNATTTGSLSASSQIINNAAIAFARTNTVVQGTDFANNISGTGSVSVSSGGTYTFTANSFQGGMTLSGAAATQLNINAATALGTGTFTINSGDLARIDNTSGGLVTLNNNAQAWSNNFTFVGTNDLNMGTGAVTMSGTRTITVSAGNLTVGGAISGTGFGITKRGSGTLILNGATTSNYTGAVTLGVTNGTDGILVLGKDTALGTSAGGLVITGGTQTGGVQLTGGITIADAITFEGRQTSTQGDFISNLSGNNIVTGLMTGGVQGNNYNVGSQAGLIDFQGGVTTAQAGRLLNLRGAGDGKISGLLTNTGTGTLGIRLQGSGTWELSAANTHVGNTSIAGAGTLKLTNNLALQNSALDTLYTGGGTVDFSSVNAPTLGGLTNSGNVVLSSNVTSLTLNLGAAAAQVYSGSLSGGTTMQLIKSGAGSQTLSGSNSYSGLTTVSAGMLIVGHNAALGSTAGETTVTNSTAALVLANGVTVTGESILISGTGGTAGTGANFNGALQAAASGSAEWAGTVKINSSDARVGAGTGGSLNISGAIVDNAGFNNLNIGAGAGGGTGTVMISAASGTNTYSGLTTITRGTLKLGADNTLPTGTTLDVDNANAGENAIFDLGGYNQSVAGLQRTNNGGGAGGAIITNSGAADKTLTINQSATTTFSGVIQDGATNKTIIVKDGSGSLTLSTNNTYTGGTRVGGGTLVLGHATNTLADTGAVNVDGGTLALGANTDTVGTVTLTSGSITGTTGVLTGTGSNYDFRSGSVSAVLGGSIGLNKTTAGTVTLSNSNTYSGVTSVSEGTLALSGTGSIASSSRINLAATTTLDITGRTGGFTLGAAQTMSGVGTVLATGSSVTAAGTLSPGNSPGTLVQDGGVLTLGAGGNFNWQIYDATGAAGTGYDSVSLINGATLDLSSLSNANPYLINLWSLSGILPDANGDALNFNSSQSYTWTLFSTGSSITGFDKNLFQINLGANNGTAGFSNALNDGVFSVVLGDNNTDLMLQFTAVPETSVSLLGGLSALLLLRRRRSA